MSMGLFQYSAFIGAFTLGVFFALGWAPCAVSLVFPVLIWLISQNVTPPAGGMMLFCLWCRSWRAGDSYCNVLSGCRRADRGEVHLCRKVDYQGLRAGGDLDRVGLCGEVLRLQALVDLMGGRMISANDLEQLIQALKDSDNEVRMRAQEFLGRFLAQGALQKEQSKKIQLRYW